MCVRIFKLRIFFISLGKSKTCLGWVQVLAMSESGFVSMLSLLTVNRVGAPGGLSLLRVRLRS